MGKQAFYRDPESQRIRSRFYTNEHVQRLLLVKRLMGEGHSLAELARLDNDALDIPLCDTNKAELPIMMAVQML